MSKSIEALKRIETIFPFNRKGKSNYYSNFLKSEIPFYEDFELVLKDLEELEKIKSQVKVDMDIYDTEEIHENCTVQILSNSKTGKCSIGWWENHKKEELV